MHIALVAAVQGSGLAGFAIEAVIARVEELDFGTA
jgi:hypothetical protein